MLTITKFSGTETRRFKAAQYFTNSIMIADLQSNFDNILQSPHAFKWRFPNQIQYTFVFIFIAIRAREATYRNILAECCTARLLQELKCSNVSQRSQINHNSS
jgi:hypothetical protein